MRCNCVISSQPGLVENEVTGNEEEGAKPQENEEEKDSGDEDDSDDDDIQVKFFSML